MIKNIFFILFLFNQLLSQQNKDFVIVIPSYKNEKWYKKNLDSVFRQTYKNYRVIYIADDLQTGQLVNKYIKDNNLENKIILKQNSERKLALYNIYYAIHSCNDNEIIVCLDGDDWLSNKYVLQYLNQVYNDENVWLTYGQFIEYPNNVIGSARELPIDIIINKQVRRYDWVTTHLRTFYAGLFKKIKKEDLLYEDKFYPMSGDISFMTPIVEMAYDKVKFINKVLYIYNRENPLNDNKLDKELQCKLFTLIRSKNPYSKINSYVNEETIEKIDIVIFSYDLENLKTLLNIFTESKNSGEIIVFSKNLTDQSNLKNQYSNIKLININTTNQLDLKNIINHLLKNDNKYFCIINDNLVLNRKIDLSQILRSIALTDAFGFYLFSENNLVKDQINKNRCEVLDDIYYFEFDEYNISSYINGLILKKQNIFNSNNPNNINNFEIEWRYIGWKKNCLAQVIGK